MSASAHDDHASGHAPGAGSGHDAYDGEPATELGPGEPRTPLWLPAVGAALFVLAGIVLVSRDGADAAPAKARAEGAATAAPAAPTAAPMQATRPAPPAGGSARPVSPDQARELQRKIDEMRRQRGAPTGAPATPPPAR